MIILSVEGNIGSGKSSLMRRIQHRLPSNVKLLMEPVHLFSDYKGSNPLKTFYADPKRYGFFLQTHIIDSQLAHFQNKVQQREEDEGKIRLLISERNLYSPIIFTHTLFKSECLAPMERDKLIEHSQNVLETTLPNKSMGADYLFYLHLRPTNCKKRIQVRGREGEEGITTQYLSRLEHEYASYIETFKRTRGATAVRTVEGGDTKRWTIEEALLAFIFDILEQQQQQHV